MGTNTEKEDKQLLLEKKIHDLQQENESLQGDVPQKYDYLQQIISAQVKTVSQLEGRYADRYLICAVWN